MQWGKLLELKGGEKEFNNNLFSFKLVTVFIFVIFLVLIFIVSVTHASLRLLSRFVKRPTKKKSGLHFTDISQNQLSCFGGYISTSELKIAFSLLKRLLCCCAGSLCSHEGICRETHVNDAICADQFVILQQFERNVENTSTDVIPNVSSQDFFEFKCSVRLFMPDNNSRIENEFFSRGTFQFVVVFVIVQAILRPAAHLWTRCEPFYRLNSWFKKGLLAAWV